MLVLVRDVNLIRCVNGYGFRVLGLICNLKKIVALRLKRIICCLRGKYFLILLLDVFINRSLIMC